MFTNDGEMAEKLTHPSYNKKKIYQVTLNSDLSQEDYEKILGGVTLTDGDIAADELEFIEFPGSDIISSSLDILSCSEDSSREMGSSAIPGSEEDSSVVGTQAVNINIQTTKSRSIYLFIRDYLTYSEEYCLQ